MTLNKKEIQRLQDIRDIMALIDMEVSIAINSGMDAPLVLILEARMLSRESAAIKLSSDARKYYELGNESKARQYEEKAMIKQASQNEIRQIIAFLKDGRTKVSLPPHMTDEDEEYFL